MSIALPIQTTVVAGGVRRTGWRGALRDGRTTAWRCGCAAPHARQDLAIACTTEQLGRRGSGFYQGRDYMDEWLPVPESSEAWQQLGIKIQGALRDLPRTEEAARDALVELRAAIMEDETMDDIRDHQARVKYIRDRFGLVQELREQSETVLLIGEWKIARPLADQPVATGTRSQLVGPGIIGGDVKSQPINDAPTLKELVGDRKYAWRLKQIAALGLEGLESAINELHRAGKEATLTAIVQLLRMTERSEETAWRRLNSMTAPRTSGMALRIGDARVVLSDIADNSIPLILTDPPYGNAAEPLYEWLAQFAARVLIPGGSLICYTGQGLLPRDYRIFSQCLTYNWTPIMLHNSAQKLFQAGVVAYHKPILWYVKEFRRPDVNGHRTLIPDVVHNSKRDKSTHDWAQGDGGVRRWIHELTEPGETIVDPFAGTAEWGRIACEEGRLWIGADIEAGGTTSVVADDIEEAAA